MPPACLKQVFRIVALDRCGNHSRSKRNRSNVLPKYVSARRFFARLASEIFLTSLQTAFFNNLLDADYSIHCSPSALPRWIRMKEKAADIIDYIAESRIKTSKHSVVIAAQRNEKKSAQH